MKERPILFSTPMVSAILEGRKTQTRRIIKPQPGVDFTETCDCDVCQLGRPKWRWYHRTPSKVAKGKATPQMRVCPYGVVGDHLWVRETFGMHDTYDDVIFYKADNGETNPFVAQWKPSIHMPRSASRITLEVCSVRVERLQDISDRDVLAEGIKCWIPGPETPNEYDTNGKLLPIFGWGEFPEGRDRATARTAVDAYSQLWESIHAAGSWEANPWVFVIEFKTVNP